MHPSRYLPKRFTSKRDEDFAPLLLAFNQPGSFEQLQVLGHRVQSRVERLRDIQESGRSVCELPDDRSPSRVGNGCQHIGQLIHVIHYTIRCNVLQAHRTVAGGVLFVNIRTLRANVWRGCLPSRCSIRAGVRDFRSIFEPLMRFPAEKEASAPDGRVRACGSVSEDSLVQKHIRGQPQMRIFREAVPMHVRGRRNVLKGD